MTLGRELEERGLTTPAEIGEVLEMQAAAVRLGLTVWALNAGARR